MLQRGNDAHRRVLVQVTQLDNQMKSWVDKVAQSLCGTVPPSTLHEVHDPYLSESEDEDGGGYIKDPTTSARIRIQDATGIVYRFASSLRTNPDQDWTLFEYKEVSHGARLPMVQCTVHLCHGSPVAQMSSPPCASRSEARRIACYRMCLELFNRGVLEYDLFPQPSQSAIRRRRAPDVSVGLEPDDVLGISAQSRGSGQNKLNGTRSYPRKRPDFWSNALITRTNKLYPTILLPEHSATSPETYAPMLLLTRVPLPRLPHIKIFQTGVSMTVSVQRGSAFDVNEEKLYLLYRYTLRLSRALMNKPFVCPLDRMPYFFAPLSATWTSSSTTGNTSQPLPSVAEFMPWDSITTAADRWVVPLQADSLEVLANDVNDAIIQDRWVEHTRRYFVVKVRPDLTPLSKPADSPVSSFLTHPNVTET
jgi:endoribonuclease Dicer